MAANTSRKSQISRHPDRLSIELARVRPAALRRHARFHDEPHADATMQLAAFAALERSSLPELIAHLEDAVASRNLALAEAVRLEFSRRTEVPNETTTEFARVFSSFPYPSDSTLAALREVRGSASMADTRISEFLRGRSNPAARITAARKMGLD